MSKIKNLIIGDVHGHYDNLKEFLIEQGAIDQNGKRINRDSLRVYCTGDLVDGGVNRMGDLMLLENAREWFDEIVIGNHELPFLGGPSFLGLRSHDRELQRALLQLEFEGKYVPATVVNDTLLVHGGLSHRWSFHNAQDACDIIRMFWDSADEETKSVPILDWIGPARGGKFADDVGGVFWCDWYEARNKNFNQIVGHSTLTNGPVVIRYGQVEHWNIDVGGKYGYGLGGVILEEGKPTVPVFWGQRVVLTKKSFTVESDDQQGTLSWDDVDEWENDYDPDEVIDLDDPENYSLWKELMEEPA